MPEGTDPTTETPEPQSEKTLTQEQVDKIVETRLARERDKQQKERDEEKQKLEDEKKSDIEKLTSRVTAAEKKAQEAEERAAKSELTALKAKVGKAADLPDAFIDLLQGSTEDELKAHADTLKESIGGIKPPPTNKPRPKPGTPPDNGDQPDASEAMNDWIRSQVRKG